VKGVCSDDPAQSGEGGVNVTRGICLRKGDDDPSGFSTREGKGVGYEGKLGIAERYDRRCAPHVKWRRTWTDRCGELSEKFGFPKASLRYNWGKVLGSDKSDGAISHWEGARFLRPTETRGGS